MRCTMCKQNRSSGLQLSIENHTQRLPKMPKTDKIIQNKYIKCFKKNPEITRDKTSRQAGRLADREMRAERELRLRDGPKSIRVSEVLLPPCTLHNQRKGGGEMERLRVCVLRVCMRMHCACLCLYQHLNGVSRRGCEESQREKVV